MERGSARLSAISQLFAEHACDAKSRIWQLGYQSHLRAEVICPEPRHACNPYALTSPNRFCTSPMGNTGIHGGDTNLDVLDILLNKDDGNLETSKQSSFFCGSPPVRTTNPIVQDAFFRKQAAYQAYPFGYPPSTSMERGSPLHGSSNGVKPQVRIEGFNCRNSDRSAVPALA